MDKSPDAFRTISEVSDWLETPAHVLRFWESRFTQLKPVKRAGGRRYYRPGDMALLGGIKKLLHDDGLTIRGVQKILREQGVRYVAALGPLAAHLHGGADLTTVAAVAERSGARHSDREAGPEAPMDADVVAESALITDGSNVVAIPAASARPDQAADARAGQSGRTEATGDDPSVPADLEAEWAAILAREATTRSSAGLDGKPAAGVPEQRTPNHGTPDASSPDPSSPDPGEPAIGDLFAAHPVPPEPAGSVESDTVAALPPDRRANIPPLVETDAGILPVPIATLLRCATANGDPARNQALARLYLRLANLRQHMGNVGTPPRR